MAKRLTMADMVKHPWFKSRPRAVKDMILKYPPGYYRLKTTGQKVLLRSYTEKDDGTCTTCTIFALQKDNPWQVFDRHVFGIPLADLEPLDTL